MNYEEALNFIHSIPKFIRPLGNKNLGALLEVLGNPHKDVKFIHIAGTNGKGSTAAMLSAVLTAGGYKTAMFTSPFIEVFNERIQINSRLIPDDCLASLTERVKTAMEENGFFVSEFAFITAMAFLYFKEQNCDIAVLETGLGGRMDATNIIEKPIVTVITAIGYDHMQFLGDTLEKIAAEKCGIIKPGCPVVSQPNTAVREIIEKYAASMRSELIFCDTAKKTADKMEYKGKEYTLALKGGYQLQNAAGVIETVGILRKNGFKISDSALRQGLANTRWLVRFEWVRDNVVIDGGHNIDGIRALKSSLRELDTRIITVAAMMEDKAVNECMKEISDFSDTVIATQIDMPRCMSADELAKAGKADICEPDFKKAISKAAELAAPDKTVCICGSLYFAAEAKKFFSS